MIDRHLGRLINIRDLMTRLRSTDVIASGGFGVKCNSLGDPVKYVRRLDMKFFSKCWKTSVHTLLAFVAQMIWHGKLIDIFVEGVVMQEFLQVLVQLSNQGTVTEEWEMEKENQEKSLSVEKIAVEAFVFLNAGYETTPSMIAFCIFELCRNRELLARVMA